MDFLDFVLYHILSIHSYEDSGITTIKAIDNINPKVALYSTIDPSASNRYKTISMEATALNICAISKTIDKLSPDEREIKDILCLSLEYQLYYCIENIKSNNSHIPTLAALIESCVNISILIGRTGLPLGSITDERVDTWINSLLSTLIEAVNTSRNNIYDLATATRSLYVLSMHSIKYDHDHLITKNLLELLERRSYLGLLEVSPLDTRIASLSHHLFVIETLLMGHLHIGLDNIYEEAISLFNKIYTLSYCPISQLLAFQKGSRIRYTAEDLGLIMRSLSNISRWTDDPKVQTRLLSIDRDLYGKIISKFMERCNNSYENRKLYPLLFPSRLIIDLSHPNIDWKFHRRRNLAHILSLCNCLLDLSTSPHTDISPSYIDTFIDILLGILN